jgi:hypothetical protein
MLKASTLLVSLLMFVRPAQAQDAFSSIRCGATISNTLIGKVMPQGRVVDIEIRHQELGLKDVGASEISSSLTFESWTICGNEYALLVDRREVVRDVLLLPEHSRRRPRFLGSCEIAARKMPGAILAVLDNISPLEGERHYALADSTLLPAISAWRIDEERLRFVKISSANVRCPRNGISTIDGGP